MRMMVIYLLLLWLLITKDYGSNDLCYSFLFYCFIILFTFIIFFIFCRLCTQKVLPITYTKCFPPWYFKHAINIYYSLYTYIIISYTCIIFLLIMQEKNQLDQWCIWSLFVKMFATCNTQTFFLYYILYTFIIFLIITDYANKTKSALTIVYMKLFLSFLFICVLYGMTW